MYIWVYGVSVCVCINVFQIDFIQKNYLLNIVEDSIAWRVLRKKVVSF